MPPVGAALVAIGGAFNTAALAVGASVGLSTGATFAAVGVFQQLAAGVALSALSRALMPVPGVTQSGTKVSLTFGEAQAQSFILGRYCTAGDLVFHGSHNSNSGGAPNQFYTQVIELADWPARLVRLWVNGEWAELRTTPGPDGYGFAVKGYDKDGRDLLWVKFYDGTQTSADAMLMAKYPSGAANPWTSDMIGKGIPYLIVTARYDPDVHRGGKPEVRAELEAWGHYDPRKDTTAGGSGSQRWPDWRTWAPSENLAVQAYNVMRGIHDPITGEFVWGGQGVSSGDLPASDWFAAMNECDRAVQHKSGGTDPQYHGGLEVRLSDEPASVLELLLKGCQGAIAECAGQWTMRAGPPGIPVYAFSDDDVIITSPDSLDPFPGLDAAYNGVSATYPEPDNGWEPKDAPARQSTALMAEDGGRRQTADLQFAAVSNRRQVQRLMKSALAEGRRFRRHTVVLPPEARKIGPLDEITWTSDRNGYPSKDWSVDMIEDSANGCHLVALRERDPDDYSWTPDDELPAVITPTARPPRVKQPGNFSVEPATVLDSDGDGRAPAIRLRWILTPGVDAIRYRVRLAATGAVVSLVGQGSDNSGGGPSAVSLTLNGAPLTVNGEALTFVTFENEEALELLISGRAILPNTAYLVDAIFAPTEGRVWQRDMAVTTPNIRISERDLEQTIIDTIEGARTDAAQAVEDVLAVQAQVIDIDERISAISEETLDRLDALVAALGSFDLAALERLTGIGRAGLMRGGWVKDPSFLDWTSGALDHWTAAGFSTYAALDPDGAYGSSLGLDIPTGSSVITLTSSSSVTGQMIAADPKAAYVTIGVEIRCLAGSVTNSRLRAEWFDGTNWVRGHAFGQENSTGAFASWGFVVDAGRTQSFMGIWKRPIENATAVRLILMPRGTGTAAVKLRVDYLNIATTSDADVKAFLANGYADAEIEDLRLSIVGPGGAIAAVQETLRTEFGDADAEINTALIALSTSNSALAGRLQTVEASFGGQNLVRNPRFRDGVRAAGVDPDYWDSWPLGLSVVARDPLAGENAVRTAPSAFVARVAPDMASYTARAVDQYPTAGGDRFAARMKVAGSGSGISFKFMALWRWYNEAGSNFQTNTQTFDVTSTSWELADFGEQEAPMAAVALSFEVRRVAGGTTSPGFFTDVELTKGDMKARALITEAAVAASDAKSAVATWQTKVAASFGDYDTFLTQTQTAVATAEGAETAYVIRNIGGSFGFYGWDNKTGTGAAFRVNAANVLLEGTVSAGEVVVTDLGFNMVPDNQLQSRTAWSHVIEDPDFIVIPDTSNDAAGSQGEIRSIEGRSNVFSDSRPFPVRAGQVLTCEGEFGRVGGSTMSVRALLVFMDRAGSVISGGFVTLFAYSGTTATRQTFEEQIEVPSGARRAKWRWQVFSTDGQARFWAPSVVRRSKGSALITPDGAFFEMLTAQTAWIGTGNIIDANVTTLKMGEDSVTIPIFAQRTSDFDCPLDSDWHDILSFNVPLTEAGRIVVNSCSSFIVSSIGEGSEFRSNWRLIIDGTTVFSSSYYGQRGVMPMCGAKVCAKGNRLVRVQFSRSPGYGLPTSNWTSAWSIGAMR